MVKNQLYDKALATVLHSRFIARADDLGRSLTDEEVREEAEYQLETISYNPSFEGDELRKAKRQLKSLLK